MQRDKTMADKWMYISMAHKITPSVDYNQWLKRLNTQFNNATNHNLVKVVKPTNAKTLS